ncbi:calcineurin-like phosphoesterase family protein [Georgenia soli]|uniref:Calcineurin-like phosphoesterase family protein n=1 Tax=Georgenia soli TaxID=638953 RepID=A0A2A9ENK1_9MICO|nr:metallophosphoesterase [Georgenia soli]PFG39832.1 calcineurin-like phosphoesterase family protein [Georgenia soli]
MRTVDGLGRWVAGVTAVVLLAGCGSVAETRAPASQPDGTGPAHHDAASRQDLCSLMTDAVHQRIDPRTDNSILTTSRAEADTAQHDGGFSDDDGVAFLGSATAREGLRLVHHLLRPATGQHAYTLEGRRLEDLIRDGYILQEDGFFASAKSADCLEAVHELVRAKDGQQRLAITDGQREELMAAGFADLGVSFFVATDTVFTLAVLPDTQKEVHPGREPNLFLHRAQWLASNEDALDLRYITHTGDVVDWDTPGHEQYKLAHEGVAVLDATGIPYSFAVGNHDAMATAVGGSARDGANTQAQLRHTETFNTYFGVDHVENLRGTFEEGKVDNSYSTFTAGGVDWLVLHLELWPRLRAVHWASEVLAAHRYHNAIIVTHSFLEADGSISQDNGGYGNTSPQFVLDHLVARAPNVRFVLSGHTGTWAHSEQQGVAGNPIHIIQTAYHDDATNPTRLIEIDTQADSFTTSVYAPYTDTTKQDGSAFTVEGLELIE